MVINLISRARHLICLALLFLIFSKCKTISNDTIQAVQFYHTLPFVKNNGQVYLQNDSVNIYYYKNLIFFRKPYQNLQRVQQRDQQEHVFDTLVNGTIGYKYFLYKQNNLWGLTFDSLSILTGKVHRVDSFLTTTVFGNVKFYNNSNDSLIDIEEMETETVLEKHIPKIKYDRSYPDSIYFFLDKKLVHLKYVLSGELDSVRQSKLFKIVSIYNSFYDTLHKLQMPRREFVFGIKQIKIDNKKEILSFLVDFDKANLQTQKSGY